MSNQTTGMANLSTIMKDISEALSLDRNDKLEDAYRKYLECVLRITTKLLKTLHSDGGQLVVSKEVSKFVKLGQQCMDRVGSLVSDKYDSGSNKKPPDERRVGGRGGGGMTLQLKSPKSPLSALPGGVTSPNMTATQRVVSPGNLTSPDENQNTFSSDPITSDVNSTVRKKKLTPLEMAMLHNKQLLKAFKARQLKSRTTSATANLSLTLQRKMAENIAIGQAQEKALALRMKQRQQRLEEQTARRFHAPIGLSAEEQEQRQIYRRVLEFEQDEINMYDWRKRLEEKPRDEVTISQLIKNVLSYKDHPLTQELEKHQKKTLYKLQPLVENKMSHLNQIRVPLPDSFQSAIGQYQLSFSQSEAGTSDQSKSLSQGPDQSLEIPNKDSQNTETVCSCETEEETVTSDKDMESKSSSQVDVKRTICDKEADDPNDKAKDLVEESDQTKDETNKTPEIVSTESGNIEEDEGSSQVTLNDINMEDISAGVKHDLQKAMIKGKYLRTSLESENQRLGSLVRHISQDYEAYNAENMDDLFDEEEDGDVEDLTVSCPKSIESSATEPDNKESKSSSISEPEDKIDSPAWSLGPSTGDQQNPNYDALEKRLKQLRNEAYHRHLEGISEDIASRIERLQVLFVVMYEDLDSAEGKDQCNLILEAAFFRPLWQYILALFRLTNEPKEISVAHIMTKYSDSTPEDFGVREKLCLDPGNSSHDNYAYKAAVDELQRIHEYPAMLSKLDCLVHTSRLVIKCVEQYYGKGNNSPSIGADDLLPVLCYVVVRCRLPQIVSECQAMGRFIHEGYMFGEEGYCLTSFQTAINYLVSLGMKTEP